MNSNNQKQLLRYIISHPSPHLDELCAIWLIMVFGDRRFQLFNDQLPEILFMHWEKARVFALENEGVIILGMGRGEFDDHGRMPKTCTARLVAEYLRVSKLRELHLILKEVFDGDTVTGIGHFDLGNLIKSWNGRGCAPEVVYERVAATLDDLLEDSRDFCIRCPEVFEKEGKVEIVEGIRIAFVTSDIGCMQKWLRSQRQASLCVIRRSTGHVQIHCDGSDDGRKALASIALSLQSAELDRRNAQPRTKKKVGDELEKIIDSGLDEYIPGADWWYFFQTGGYLLNGSPSHPEAKPTSLGNLSIFDAVVEAIQIINH